MIVTVDAVAVVSAAVVAVASGDDCHCMVVVVDVVVVVVIAGAMVEKEGSRGRRVSGYVYCAAIDWFGLDRCSGL